MSDRFERFSAAIAERLERVRGGMTDAEFARLVADVAEVARRFEEIDARERGRSTPMPGTVPALRKPDATAT